MDDESRKQLRDAFIDRRGYWNTFWDGLLEVDPEFLVRI